MGNSFIGKAFPRNEDRRLLTGQALFVDDVDLPNMAHVAFVRSPHAHARILDVDLSDILGRPGLVAAYTAADLGSFLQHAPLLVPPPPVESLVFHKRTFTQLATDKVRHVGEPIVMIVAEDRYQAEDLAALVKVDYEVLSAVVDLEQALQSATTVHDDLPGNLAAHVVQRRGNYGQAVKSAHLTIRRTFRYDRGTAAAIENRAVVASWDKLSQRITVWDTTQAPIPIRNGLSRMLGLHDDQVRVVAPFLGGGFGPKVMMFYPEESLIPWASMRLNRPIKWVEDRWENFHATSQERNQVHEAELSVDQEGHIIGVRDFFLHDSGAYDPYGLTVPINSQCTLLSTYDVPHYDSEFKVAFTNKPIVTPLRGAGRQHGVFVMERLLDLAARELGLDPVEIRRRNLIAPDQFPRRNTLIYQDFKELIYDSGNYGAALEKALELVDYDGFKKKQPALQAAGRHVGIGVVSYVEGTGIGPYEGARVLVQTDGKVGVTTGVGTQGQGHFTSLAQIAADRLGVSPADVHVVTGDTDLFHWGTGTFASRGAVVAGNAVYAAAQKVRNKCIALAADVLSEPAENLELEQGRVCSRVNPDRSIPLGELAALANPLRGAVTPGTEPGLEATEYFGPASGATASGVHAVVLEVDPDTYEIKLQKYIVVHDCGEMINPLIVEGQIHGGVAMGIGNALYEQLHFDERGSLVNANLRDYLLPTTLEVPPIRVAHVKTPSPLNPMGTKGVGEAGAIPVAAAIAQAIESALPEAHLEILSMPFSASTLFDMVQSKVRSG